MWRTLAWLALPLSLVSAPLWAAPEAAREYIAQARVALARGDGIAAEADLVRAQAAGASRTELAADMGEAFIQQNERAKAREWLAPGQFDPGSKGRGWRLLGLLERLDGNPPAAARALDQAIQATPRDPLVWVEVGRTRYQGGEQLQAIEAADRALAFGPNHVRALELRAQLLRDSAGDAAALPLYERALAAAPNDLLILGGYAASLGELGRAREMLAVTRKMLAIDPGNAQAFFLQAVLAARTGKLELARSMLYRAGPAYENVPAALLLGGALELEAGNANAATQLLMRLADQQGNNPRAQLLLARALLEAGDHQQLHARFGALAGRGDASPYLLTILGRALEEQGDHAGAAALLDRAAAAPAPALMAQFESVPSGVLAPRWNEAQGNGALTAQYLRSLLGSGNTAAARQVASRLLAIRPAAVDALGLGGDVELASGQPIAALQHYDRVSAIRISENLVLRSAIALELAGKSNTVPGLIGRYLAINPASRMATRIAANLALQRKDWRAAQTLLENLRRQGGDRDARLLADLSRAQLGAGNAAAALDTSKRAWELAPQSPFSAQARGLALVALNRDPDLARQLLELARKTGGDNPELAAARQKLR